MAVDTSNATATAGVDPSRARIAGAIKQAASYHRHQLRISARHREDGIQFQSDGRRLDLVGARALSIHRSDLARHREGSRLAARLRQLRRRHHQILVRHLFGQRSRRANGDHEAARRSRRQFGDGGRADPVQQFPAHRQDRPPPDRRRTLYGALHGRRRRRQADLERRGHPAGLGRALFPNAAAANRSIFYRSHRTRAQRLRSLFGAERRAMPVLPIHRRRAPRWPRSASDACRLPTIAGAVATPVVKPAFLSSFPDVRSATPVTTASASTTANAPAPSDPMFRSLFQVGDRTQPVSPAIHELWGNSSSLTSVAPATSVAQSAATRFARRSPAPARAAARSVQRSQRQVQQLTQSLATRDRGGSPGARTLNKTSIKPAVYGERFVKRHGLFLMTVASRHGVVSGCVSRQDHDRSAVHQLDKDRSGRRAGRGNASAWRGPG